MLKIDEARSEDLSEVLAITLSAYEEYKKQMSSEAWQRYRDNIEQAIMSDPSTTVIVARDNDAIKGSVLLCNPKVGLGGNTYPEMRLLAVPPQSRNQGIAAALIEECERRAVNAGILTLHTTRLMDTARAMYERRGYVRYPEIDFQPGPGFVVWGYKKDLGDISDRENIKAPVFRLKS